MGGTWVAEGGGQKSEVRSRKSERKSPTLVFFVSACPGLVTGVVNSSLVRGLVPGDPMLRRQVDQQVAIAGGGAQAGQVALGGLGAEVAHGQRAQVALELGRLKAGD